MTKRAGLRTAVLAGTAPRPPRENPIWLVLYGVVILGTAFAVRRAVRI
jgi:hypothetical protein